MRARSKIRDTAVFAFLGTVMFASKVIMEALPNIHLLGTLIVAYTVVYRKKALLPIYVFVLLQGLYSGFSAWWIPYLYVWLPLWAGAMLLPANMPPRLAPFVYMTLSALHGLLFGVLFAPAQAILFGLSFESTLAWIGAGLPFDVIHAVSNFLCGTLIAPLVSVLKRLETKTSV